MKVFYKQFYLTGILLVLFNTQLFAQRASFLLMGTVKDAENGDALVGATVKTSPSQGTATDAEGKYKLTLDVGQPATITFSYIGYKNFVYNYEPAVAASLINAGQLVINVLLEPEITGMEQVVVTASRSEQKLKSVTVSIELIKPYLLEGRNNVNINQMIDQIPSVSFVDGQANIRGGSGWSYGAGTRVLVMLDDMPMLSGDAGQAQWSYIPTENIEQVEVIKGASSVLYGSSALNGIINIRTIRPRDKPYTAANLFSGFYDKPARKELEWQPRARTLWRNGANVVHAQRWGRFEGTFSINYLNDEGYRMSDPEKRGRFSFNTRYTPKKIKNMYYGINGNVMKSTAGSFLLWESFTLGYTQLDSGHNLTDGTRFNLDPYAVFYNGKTRHSIRGRYFYLDNKVDNGDPTNNQSNTSNYYYAEYQVQHTFDKINMNIVGGVAGSYSTTNSPIFQGVHTTANLAPFVQVEKKWAKLTVNAGARYENFRLDAYKESKPVFRAGLNYEAAKATFVRASFGQGYRFPTIVESFVKTSAGPLNIYPNPNLKSETGWNAEVGVKQGVKLGKWMGYVDVAGFWMEFNRMMEFNFGQWGPNLGMANLLGLGFSSVNVGRARINGVDISLGGEGKVGKTNITLIGGYTYMNPQSLDPDRVYGHDINNNPLTYHKSSSDTTSDMLKYRFNHMAKLDAQVTYRRWTWGASIRYNSYIRYVDRFFTDPLFAAFVPGINEARKMGEKGDYIIDYRMSFMVSARLKAGVVVNNVLNRLYMTRPADLRPPRMFVVQLNYKIDKN